jgi:DNA-binding transcriptional LysR family regulator
VSSDIYIGNESRDTSGHETWCCVVRNAGLDIFENNVSMDHSVLRALAQTARTGSIRKASEALGMAPSSVSRAIAALEHEMGTALFQRRARGVELTHAGRLVAEYASSVLLEYDSLRADLEDMRGTARHLLRLAFVESITEHGPVTAVSKLLARFPTVSFNVRRMPAPRVSEAVLEEQCDVGIAFCAEPNPDILTLASVPEPIMLGVHPKHRLASAKNIALRDVDRMPLAAPDVDFGVRQILDRAAALSGIRLAPVLNSNDFEILRDFARSGAGAAVLPMRAITSDERAGRLVALPLLDSTFRATTIDIIVLRKRRLPRVVKAFADILIAEIRAAR